MQSQFSAAINQLCDEKNIPKETVMEAIKAALRAAYRKDYGTKDQNIDVEIGEEGIESIVVYLIKDVVKKVEDEELQITEKEAKKYKKDAKSGDQIKIDVTPVGYGRIAAQSAKQVIIQRLQDAERESIYDTFKDRENELINALVHRVEGRSVYINLDKATAILTPDQQIPRENYYGGQRLKIYLDKVIKTSKGPQLIISRSHPNLVHKLLELEIPEIKNELVHIKGIAREPGVRTKVAVHSDDEKIDPIGSCVGQKGVRILNVMDEINGERIDIIHWNADEKKYIEAALAPAKVAKIEIDEKYRHVKVFVNTDQRPLAIGKQGQNVRLASRLTGYEIDIMDAEEAAPHQQETKKAPKKDRLFSEVESVPAEVVEKLTAMSLINTSQVQGLRIDNLVDLGLTEDEAKLVLGAIH